MRKLTFCLYVPPKKMVMYSTGSLTGNFQLLTLLVSLINDFLFFQSLSFFLIEFLHVLLIRFKLHLSKLGLLIDYVGNPANMFQCCVYKSTCSRVCLQATKSDLRGKVTHF